MQFKNIKLFTNKEIENITMFYNEQEIKVKRYLPINDKLDLISWIINQSADELKFYNVGKIIVFKAVGLVKYYTELDFTEEELNDISNLYDKLYQSGFLEELLITIPEEELNFIDMVLDNTVDSIYKYQNSVMGILDTVTADYKDLNFDIEQLQKNISNPENLTLLKDVVTKLG